ncbi:MAG: hypothetical protein IPM59_06010 [Chloracidobacterium sp.]|nr:hypothetical protein [Chloracidobacterium sp.]
MKTALCIGLFVFTGFAAFAQTTDKAVNAIDRRYKDIAEKARLCETDDDQGEFGELVMNTLDINARSHQWRAVGIYRPVYKFFYKQVENDEKRLYPDHLVFVVGERKVSAITTREEFLFSDAGALIYYSYTDDMGRPEIKAWFAAGKAIRIEQDGKGRTRMTKADVETTGQRLATAAKLMQVFKRSIEL